MNLRPIQRWCLPLILLGLSTFSLHAAEEWGTLKGQIIYDGKAPQPKPIDASKEPHCSAKMLTYEELVVGKEGGLENAVVYLRTEKVDVAPEYAQTADSEVEIDNKDCRFVPHVVLMRPTQTLVVKNSDPPPVSHNSKVDTQNNAAQNLTIPPGQSLNLKFDSEETMPAPVSCGIHPWMRGYILIRNTPYMAVTDDKGNFEIKDLPVGKELEFQLWQEKAGYLKNADAKGVKVDKKGRFKIKIKPGENDLGVLKVSPSIFK